MTNRPKSPTSNTEKFKQSTTEETWRSDTAREAICDAAERIANHYCSEDDTYNLEVRRLRVAIINAVDQRATPASAAPVVGHHKHCSAWTVTTSGEKKSCDCVCECSHTMFEHIRPGEHYWYEDCAADGCSCMKFTAAAATAAQTKSCGFCGKSDQEVKVLIQAPVGYICDECVAVCASIIERNRTAAPVEQEVYVSEDLKASKQPTNLTGGTNQCLTKT